MFESNGTMLITQMLHHLLRSKIVTMISKLNSLDTGCSAISCRAHHRIYRIVTNISLNEADLKTNTKRNDDRRLRDLVLCIILCPFPEE